MIKKIILLIVLIFSSNCFGDSGDIGNFGSWTTENNKESINSTIKTDLENFQGTFQTNFSDKTFVPIEAKLGFALIKAMSNISYILKNSFVDFVSIFMTIALIFWLVLEIYQMIKKSSKPSILFESAVKKAILIFIWIFIIQQSPEQLFMWIIKPLLMLGTLISDTILGSVASSIGTNLPDTCMAVQNFVGNSTTSILQSEDISSLLCLSTRFSGFFYSAIVSGFKLMFLGIGTSAFTFVLGVSLVFIFLINIWKFALMSFSVIVDLFLVILMLPFTAISHCFSGKEDSNSNIFTSVTSTIVSGGSMRTSYDGYAGVVFNKFMGIFNGNSLDSSIQRFVNAIIYFISLSIIISLCFAIFAGVGIDFKSVSNAENYDSITLLISGLLIGYLLTKTEFFAKSIGGSVDTSTGNKIVVDVKKLISDIQKIYKSTKDALKK